MPKQSWENWKGIEPDETDFPTETNVVQPETMQIETLQTIGKVAFWENGLEPDWFCFTD